MNVTGLATVHPVVIPELKPQACRVVFLPPSSPMGRHGFVPPYYSSAVIRNASLPDSGPLASSAPQVANKLVCGLVS